MSDFNTSSLITYFQLQANVVPGQPYWIADSTQPSGSALNPAAVSLPATEMMGDFPRNSLRSPYSIDQTDLALRRRFSLNERFKIDLRAEYFNVFNHPMFGAPGSNQPETNFGLANFGKVSPATTNEALGGDWVAHRAHCMQSAARAPASSRSNCCSEERCERTAPPRTLTIHFSVVGILARKTRHSATALLTMNRREVRMRT
jgi:hypothetical protein